MEEARDIAVAPKSPIPSTVDRLWIASAQLGPPLSLQQSLELIGLSRTYTIAGDAILILKYQGEFRLKCDVGCSIDEAQEVLGVVQGSSIAAIVAGAKRDVTDRL